MTNDGFKLLVNKSEQHNYVSKMSENKHFVALNRDIMRQLISGLGFRVIGVCTSLCSNESDCFTTISFWLPIVKRWNSICTHFHFLWVWSKWGTTTFSWKIPSLWYTCRQAIFQISFRLSSNSGACVSSFRRFHWEDLRLVQSIPSKSVCATNHGGLVWNQNTGCLRLLRWRDVSWHSSG